MTDKAKPCIMCGELTDNFIVLGTLPDPDPVCYECAYDPRGYETSDDYDDFDDEDDEGLMPYYTDEDEYYDRYEDNDQDFYEDYHVMTRWERVLNWLRQRPWRIKQLYWRIKWHNRCSECGIDTNNGYCLCDKHQIPF